MARKLIDRALPVLSKGHLRLVLPNGKTIERRGDMPGADATVIAHRWRGLWRMILAGEDGFTEGYLDGDWSTPELAKVLTFFADNEAQLAEAAASSWLGGARNRLGHLLRGNTKRGSRRNIAAHYDLGNDFFSAWLDTGMNYSSAVYAGAQTLEEAQSHKLDRIAGLLGLDGGERVLEIGCGWGALAERLIRGFHASVTGITLSAEQLAFAKARLAAQAERADLRLQDYRDVAGLFDRIVSIEMIEAVGARYWPAYFGKLRACLVNGGSVLLQAITIDEKRFTDYAARADFIQRYIFPGGMLPTRAIIAEEATRAGLTLVHHESFGASYVRTLREWRVRFLQAWPAIEPLGFNARFRRMWEYYLAYCEVGFDRGTIDVGFYKLAG
ncbi:MAG TPA: cyclopropane-fatty-acyl-phospholipid synthase family protein [Xanthobacteraceae bacterium]|nr:cyclopropane-fatty-acyl-phospholipid synthase family protein [Xanthobacteraceae bacterium]